MTLHYYNEIDPYAAQWLENLIVAGHLPKGDVDRRDIRDVTPLDLENYTQCHFFAGIGGWPYALRLADWPVDRPAWTGSCPCQPFSAAGKGGGFDDERHLWPDWFWLIEQCQPTVLFGEQVASKAGLAWFELVQADLEGTGYAVGSHDICAAGVGAPHIRQRLWFVAYAGGADVPRPEPQRTRLCSEQSAPPTEHGNGSLLAGVWNDPNTCPATWDDGLPRPVGIVRAAGNAIVPQVAAEFIRAYMT